MKRVTFLSPVVGLLIIFLFVMSPLASAQSTGTSLPGITVHGVGQATVPAETATVVLMLGSGDYYKDPALVEEAELPTPAASPEETAAPVIAALVAEGVPESDIRLISNPFMGGYAPYPGPTMVTLIFTLTNPDVTQISGMLMAAIDVAVAQGLYVNMTGVLYGVADCATLERDARAAAIADAREKATVQAELLDVSLGNVISSRDDTYGAIAYGGMAGAPVFNNSCTVSGELDSMSLMYSAPAFDPGIEPAVSVSAYIELTFEIAPGA